MTKADIKELENVHIPDPGTGDVHKLILFWISNGQEDFHDS